MSYRCCGCFGNVAALARAAGGVLLLQIASGGWVSTNYAVLACTGFPQCGGQWWPAMDFRQGFTILRELGHTQAPVVLTETDHWSGFRPDKISELAAA